MSNITINNLDPHVIAKLKKRASNHGCSLEEEVITILKSALESEKPDQGNLAESIQKRFAPFGGVELPNIPR